ncbi:UNVERIFIED_CONTAM: hypothetical protein Slati_2501500 [Sesamum latifolium]|uniref:Uncharacterized protein n=1 Tax=Sesamum latifolium TaxID=2727402 RepID=A0AAW2WEG9_9LAMI
MTAAIIFVWSLGMLGDNSSEVVSEEVLRRGGSVSGLGGPMTVVALAGPGCP